MTVIHQTPPGYRGGVPYVLALVVMDNDLNVLTHLVGKTPDAWKLGDKVVPCRIALGGSSTEADAVEIHAFRPADMQEDQKQDQGS